MKSGRIFADHHKEVHVKSGRNFADNYKDVREIWEDLR